MEECPTKAIDRCLECKGYGYIKLYPRADCPKCSGTGKKPSVREE